MVRKHLVARNCLAKSTTAYRSSPRSGDASRSFPSHRRPLEDFFHRMQRYFGPHIPFTRVEEMRSNHEWIGGKRDFTGFKGCISPETSAAPATFTVIQCQTFQLANEASKIRSPSDLRHLGFGCVATGNWSSVSRPTAVPRPPSPPGGRGWVGEKSSQNLFVFDFSAGRRTNRKEKSIESLIRYFFKYFIFYRGRRIIDNTAVKSNFVHSLEPFHTKRQSINSEWSWR